jgi:hypothetical protein
MKLSLTTPLWSDSAIKLIALTTMLLDHIGLVFFPHVLAFRIVGRLSFPLFAYGLVQGCQHTSNFSRYLWRILRLAIISQPIHSLLFENSTLNICWLLALALCCLRVRRWWFWFFAAAVSHVFNFDYGSWGLGLILLVASYTDDSFSWAIAWGCWSFLSFLWNPIQPFSAIAFRFFSLSNGSRGSLPPALFYWFYPVHLLFLLCLKTLLSM